jgi:hypothetical protein
MNKHDDHIYRGWTIRLIKYAQECDFFLYDTEGARVELHEEHKPSGFVDRDAALRFAKNVVDHYAGKNAPLPLEPAVSNSLP